jgi:hypothetical protein
MNPIALFYARGDVGGGSTSFAVHLMQGMQRAGIPATLYRFSTKPRAPKMLAQYEGIMCEYVTPAEALHIAATVPSLLVAPERPEKLPYPTLLTEMMAAGMRCVIHDPNEFMNKAGVLGRGVFNHLDDRTLVVRPICIRPSMKAHFKDATFIPHPYQREFPSVVCRDDLARRKSACSIARLTFVKRPRIIFDANRLLAQRAQVRFHSAENRLFTFSLKKTYPEVTQGGYDLPLVHGISARHAAQYRFAVDMTYFPMDGGGSQYSFMEAWDAGCVNVIHQDWLRYKGEMKDRENCYAVRSAEELAMLIQNWKKQQPLLEHIAANGATALKKHDAATIAKFYYKELLK